MLGIMSVGCQYVPSSGSVGQGVFAWGTYQYSTYWGWYGFNSPANYTWYVQKTGADTYTCPRLAPLTLWASDSSRRSSGSRAGTSATAGQNS